MSRAFGTLCSATMMTSEETMDLLSSVRLGVNLGLLDDLTIPTVNDSRESTTTGPGPVASNGSP